MLASQNLDGGDAVRENAERMRPYRDRVRANRSNPAGLPAAAGPDDGELP